jgi:hypothetical protein
VDYYSEDGSLPADCALKKWIALIQQACRLNKRPIDIGPELKPMLEEAGFINVQVEIYKLPHSPWPKNPKLKEIGAFSLVNMLEGLEGLSLALFTRVHGWSNQEVHAFLPEVRKDFHKKEYHLLMDMYVSTLHPPLS